MRLLGRQFLSASVWIFVGILLCSQVGLNRTAEAADNLTSSFAGISLGESKQSVLTKIGKHLKESDRSVPAVIGLYKEGSNSDIITYDVPIQSQVVGVLG